MIDQSPVAEKISGYVNDIIADDPALFLIDVVLKGNYGNQRLVISLDGDEGVSIDACVSISRALSGILEENDLIDGKYHLEVTSVGIDQPLKYPRQYQKNVGRSLSVQLTDGTKLEGTLTEVAEKGLTLLTKQKKQETVHEIGFEEIKVSKVLVSFK